MLISKQACDTNWIKRKLVEMNHSHIPPEENVVCDSLNLALILPPRTRHYIILTMDRVIHTTGTKLILSKSKYNNLGLTRAVKLAKEDIYYYVMIIISYLSLFQKLC